MRCLLSGSCWLDRLPDDELAAMCTVERREGGGLRENRAMHDGYRCGKALLPAPVAVTAHLTGG